MGLFRCALSISLGVVLGTSQAEGIATAPFLATAADAEPATICTGGDIPNCYPVIGEVQLDFARRFQGTYRPGEPYDVVTVAPNGAGESFADVGITLRVQIVCSCPGAARSPEFRPRRWSSSRPRSRPAHRSPPPGIPT